MSNSFNDIAKDLYNENCLLFGDFKLKSGVSSPYYMDLRKIISSPSLLNKVSDVIAAEVQKRNIQYDIICGVPYACIPLATIISSLTKKPLSLRRKEPKSYGTKQLIEGTFNPGDRCLVIEDVVTSGASILETVDDIENSKLTVTDIFVILIRNLESIERLNEKGYRVHYLFTIDEFAEALKAEGLITDEQRNILKSYVPLSVKPVHVRRRLSYLERASLAPNKMASKLFLLMNEKETNLCVAADLKNMQDILNLARNIGPYICVLKLHLSCILDKTEASIKELHALSEEYNFFILEDRKLADIGYVVSLQYSAISRYTKLVTAHSITGNHILEAIKKSDGYDEEHSGVFLIAQLSSANTYISPKYTEETINLAKEYAPIITGIVCQDGEIFDFPGFIQLTPGVSLDVPEDSLGQRYQTPKVIIKDKFADIAVVGRSIIQAENPIEAAKCYRSALWEQYLNRISS